LTFGLLLSCIEICVRVDAIRPIRSNVLVTFYRQYAVCWWRMTSLLLWRNVAAHRHRQTDRTTKRQ